MSSARSEKLTGLKLFAIGLAALMLAVSPSRAETEEQELARWALFKVAVEGTSSIPGKGKIVAEGRAFAVSSNVLVTARHVAGNLNQWMIKSAGKLYIPDREVSVSGIRDYDSTVQLPNPYGNLLVTPAVSETIDAVKLTAAKFAANPFKLSACGPTKNGPFKALILRGKDPRLPEFVALAPDKYSSTNFGEVFVFNNTSIPRRQIVNGDSGSPVLDADNRVIGLVSAFLGNGEQLLVTLLPSFLGLIPQDIEIRCDPRITDKNLRAIINAEVEPLKEKLRNAERDLASAQRDLEDASTQVALAVELIGHDAPVPDETLTQLMESVRADKSITINERIRRMVNDLGSERWSLVPAYSPAGSQLDVSYTRQLSREIFSSVAFACFYPLVEIQSSDHGKLKPRNEYYFATLDSPFKINLGSCAPREHVPNVSTSKVGKYPILLPASTVAIHKNNHEPENWNGSYYLQFVIQEKKDQEKFVPTIVRRFLLATSDNHVVTNCLSFDSEEQLQEFVSANGTNINEFLERNKDTGRGATYRCQR